MALSLSHRTIQYVAETTQQLHLLTVFHITSLLSLVVDSIR